MQARAPRVVVLAPAVAAIAGVVIAAGARAVEAPRLGRAPASAHRRLCDARCCRAWLPWGLRSSTVKHTVEPLHPSSCTRAFSPYKHWACATVAAGEVIIQVKMAEMQSMQGSTPESTW